MLADFLQVVETGTAEPFAGELFRRGFGTPPPDFPRHFSALYKCEQGGWLPVGYIHFWQRDSAFMGGGLVADGRQYRRMPEERRTLIRSVGGIAQHLMHCAIGMLPEHDVIWVRVGDTRSEKIVLRLGFEHTHVPNIIALWRVRYTEARRRQMADEIGSLDPF